MDVRFDGFVAEKSQFPSQKPVNRLYKQIIVIARFTCIAMNFTAYFKNQSTRMY